jgi:energy-coupling factor transporter ATP-binding protein EcfA2
MAQYIYTMNRVGKIVPPKREILKDISLSFFPGAKIGVLGLNGSGKSTLLRIMAGVDTDILGEARPQPGIKIGFLPGAATRSRPRMCAATSRKRSADQGCTGAAGRGLCRLRRSRRRFRETGRRTGGLEATCKPPMAITWSARWMSPPTRCDCRPGMPMW